MGGTKKWCTSCKDAKPVGLWDYLLLATLLIFAVPLYKLRAVYATKIQPALALIEKKRMQLKKATQQAKKLMGEDDNDEDTMFVSVFDGMVEKVKILTSNFQIMSSMPSVLKIQFPTSFQKFIAKFNFVNLDLFASASRTVPRNTRGLQNENLVFYATCHKFVF